MAIIFIHGTNILYREIFINCQKTTTINLAEMDTDSQSNN